MTRKRFIKLLMSKCISRNRANRISERAQERRLSYECAYKFRNTFDLTLELERLEKAREGMGFTEYSSKAWDLFNAAMFTFLVESV